MSERKFDLYYRHDRSETWVLQANGPYYTGMFGHRLETDSEMAERIDKDAVIREDQKKWDKRNWDALVKKYGAEGPK